MKTQKILPWQGGRLENFLWLPFLPGTFCLLKKLFNEVQGYDIRMAYGENTELQIRLGQLSKLRLIKLQVIQEALCTRFVDSINVNQKFLVKRYDSIKHLLQKHAALLNDLPMEKSTYLNVVSTGALQLGRRGEALLLLRESFATKWSFLSLVKYCLISLRLK